MDIEDKVREYISSKYFTDVTEKVVTKRCCGRQCSFIRLGLDYSFNIVTRKGEVFINSYNVPGRLSGSSVRFSTNFDEFKNFMDLIFPDASID